MSKVELEGKMRLVNPKDFHFAPENYVVPVKSKWTQFLDWLVSLWPFKPFLMGIF